MLAWIRKWAWQLLSGLLTVIGASALFALQRRRAALAAAERTTEVSNARAKIGVLRAQKQMLEEQEKDNFEALRQVNEAIEDHKKTIAAVQFQYGLTPQQVADEFAKLGY